MRSEGLFECFLPIFELENTILGLFPVFSSLSPGTGSGGQISKVILISQIVYQIVQFDELSRMVQTFFESDLPIASYD